VNSRITALAFSEDGTLLVVGSTGGTVQIHRLTPSWKSSGRCASPHGGDRGGGRPERQGFASADDPARCPLGKERSEAGGGQLGGRGIKALLFLSDQALAAGCGDGTVKILNPRAEPCWRRTIWAALRSPPGVAKDKLALAVGTQSGQVTMLALEA